MNRYQDEDWQQEEQRRREAYYRMNSQNSNTPDALEQIFRGPLNWMNLLMIGINVVIFIIMEFLGSTEDTGFMLQWGAACRPFILNGEWYRLFTSMFLHFGIYGGIAVYGRYGGECSGTLEIPCNLSWLRTGG